MMRAIFAACVAIALSGCSTIGVNAFADFGQEIGGNVTYNIGDGYGEAHGPRARAGVEMDAAIGAGFTVAGGIEHSSFPETLKDRGEERAYIGVRYRWVVKP